MFNSNAGFARVCAALIASVAGFAALSCGSDHAILEISAPSNVVAGSPFTATVTAIYDGKRDTIIDGPIHFTSSDTAAVLPTLYVFTAADAGSHTFTGLLLMTPGSQTMTVSDYDDDSDSRNREHHGLCREREPVRDKRARSDRSWTLSSAAWAEGADGNVANL